MKSGSGGGAGRGRSWCCSRARRTRVPTLAPAVPSGFAWLCPGAAAAPLLRASDPRGGGVPPPTLPGLPPPAPRSRARAGPGNCRRGRRGAFPLVARAQRSGGGGESAASRPGVRHRPPSPASARCPAAAAPSERRGRRPGQGGRIQWKYVTSCRCCPWTGRSPSTSSAAEEPSASAPAPRSSAAPIRGSSPR